MKNQHDAIAVRNFISRYRKIEKYEPLRFRDLSLGISTIYRDVDRWHTTYCFPHSGKLIRWYKEVPYTLIVPEQPYFLVMHDLKTNQIIKCSGELKRDWKYIPMVFNDLDTMSKAIPLEIRKNLTTADKQALGINEDPKVPLSMNRKYHLQISQAKW